MWHMMSFLANNFYFYFKNKESFNLKEGGGVGGDPPTEATSLAPSPPVIKLPKAIPPISMRALESSGNAGNLTGEGGREAKEER